MIDSVKVGEAMQGGMCFVCSLCERYHIGGDRGYRKLDGTVACATTVDCCGPSGGGYFGDYKGELSRWAIATRCHMCGKSADYVLKPKQSDALPVGVCNAHLPVVQSLCRIKRPGTIVLLIAGFLAGEDKWEKE